MRAGTRVVGALVLGLLRRSRSQGALPGSARRWLSSKDRDEAVFTFADANRLRSSAGEDPYVENNVGPLQALEAALLRDESQRSAEDASEKALNTKAFASDLEELDDELSKMSHRPLNTYLRPRMTDRVTDFENLLRRRCIPGVIQGAGVVMTIAVPYEAIIQDFKRGWFCSRHDEESTTSLFCGPVYDTRIYSGIARDELLYRERAYASLMLYSQEANMPISIRLVRVPLEADFEQRLPFHHFNEQNCSALREAGELRKISQGITMNVPPGAVPPRIMWIDLANFKLNDKVLAADYLAPQGSEFCTLVDHPDKVLYRIESTRY